MKQIGLPEVIAAIVLSIWILPIVAHAADDAVPSEATRPKYSFLRYTEDWSALQHATRDAHADFWDPIKYVPLSDNGDIWGSFGGHTRLRFEGWSDFAFGAPADPDDTFLLWRLTLHGDIHIGENVRVFVEGKSAQSTDRDLPGGRRALDVDSFDLEQAFADITIHKDDDVSLTIRGGRQVYLFGKQRLVSPLPWANTLRRWDGVSAIIQFNGWTVTGFWSQFAPVQKYEFNDSNSDIQFFGVYASGLLADTGIGLDVYYLGLDRDGMFAFNGTVGNETRHTIGGRIHGSFGDSNFDFDVEGAYQFGEVGGGDVSAYMFASQFGYTSPDMGGSPRFFVGFDYASGDKSAGGDVETFNQLFPLGHAYYGYMDFVGRQNAIDVSLGATFKPFDKTIVHLSGHYLLRADTSDALYNAGGGVVRAGALSDEREIGTELDLTIKYKLDVHTTLELGYSHFFTGDFIEESGSSDGMDFVYTQLTYVF